MVNLSPELEAEIRRRAVEADLPSPEALLREALDALDRERAFEELLLQGIGCEETLVTPDSMAAIREAGFARLRELQGG